MPSDMSKDIPYVLLGDPRKWTLSVCIRLSFREPHLNGKLLLWSPSFWVLLLLPTQNPSVYSRTQLWKNSCGFSSTQLEIYTRANCIVHSTIMDRLDRSQVSKWVSTAAPVLRLGCRNNRKNYTWDMTVRKEQPHGLFWIITIHHLKSSVWIERWLCWRRNDTIICLLACFIVGPERDEWTHDALYIVQLADRVATCTFLTD